MDKKTVKIALSPAEKRVLGAAWLYGIHATGTPDLTQRRQMERAFAELGAAAIALVRAELRMTKKGSKR